MCNEACRIIKALTQPELDTDVLNGMRALRLGATICALVVGGCSTSALAHLSRPVRLPSTGYSWQFAIDRGGHAIAVDGSNSGALLYSLGRGTRFNRSWPIAVTGGYSLHLPGRDISFGAGDRVAIGLRYIDGTAPASEAEHGAGACCTRAAVAAWQLGEVPPIAQTLSPQRSTLDGFQKEPGIPSVVVDRSTTTAIWSVGGNGEPPERGPAELDEGFGTVGGPLQVRPLATASNGIDDYILTRTARGVPVAAWLENGHRLRVVTGSAGGALHRSGGSQTVRRRSSLEQFEDLGFNELGGDFGFSADGAGDIVFWYVTATAQPGREELFAMTSTEGHAFTRPRLLAVIPGAGRGALVVTGAGRSLLAFWEWEDRHETGHLQAAFGHINARLVKSKSVLVGPFGGEATGFVGRNAAYVIYRRWLASYNREGQQRFRLEFTRSSIGHAFGKPRPFAPRLRGCGVNTAFELPVPEERLIATSLDGYAIVNLVCEGGAEYIVRYSP